MGILSTNKKIINLGQGYSAGSGISIDDYVISVTGEFGHTYSAGQNIDIYDDQGQLYISGKDWSADIANASSNAYEQATALIPPEFDPSYISGVVDNKLDATAFSTISGDYATTSYVDMSDDLTYSRATAWGNQNLAPLNSVADNSAKWNEIEVYEQNSATYLTAHQDISNKLDTTAFSTVSGDFLTAVDLTPYYTTAEANTMSSMLSGAIDYVSAHAGDEFPASANEAITAYQNASGTYLTAHQVIPSAKWENASTEVQSNSANWNDITVYQTNSASYLTAHQDLSNYATTGDLNTASGILSGAIDYLSGNAGKTYTGISPIVVNNTTNEISADSQDITFGEGLDFTNGILTVTASGTTYSGDVQEALDEVYTNSADWNNVYDTVEANSGSWVGQNFSGLFQAQYGVTTYNDIKNAVDDHKIVYCSSGGRMAFLAYSGLDNYEFQYYRSVTTHSEAQQGDQVFVYKITNSNTWSVTTREAYTRISAGNGLSSVYGSNKLTLGVNGSLLNNYLTTAQYETDSANWNEATTTIQTNSSTWDSVTNKLDTTAFSDVSSTFLTAVDLSPYQTIEGMTAYQPVGDYATTAQVDTISSMLSGAIDYVSANAGDEFPVSADEAIQYVQTNSANIDETVTSYQTNSSTYMVEPNLEYNAVNEISGYNGSAIAQYGAEKQWLQHDDTIVHVANSAQYAFGVNVSALQRLMGIDETVLYDGESSGGILFNNAIPLSESYKNFNTIKIINGHYSIGEIPSWLLSGGHQDAKMAISFQDANTAQPLVYGLLRYSATNDTSLIQYFNRLASFTTANTLTVTTNANNYTSRTLKVIGIGRKS